MSKEILEILRDFTAADIRNLETSDRQYKAIGRLLNSGINITRFFKLILINALMSYQLQMKGEDYWERFSDIFSENPNENFEDFLKKYNKRLLNVKLKRLIKVKSCVNRLFKDHTIEDIGKNLSLIVDELSACLKQRKESKTIVFSAKMFMYAYRFYLKKEPKGISNIDIPIDSRLSKISSSHKFWRDLSDRSNIPQIHLDAIFYLCLGGDRFAEPLNTKLSKLRKAIALEILRKNP